MGYELFPHEQRTRKPGGLFVAVYPDRIRLGMRAAELLACDHVTLWHDAEAGKIALQRARPDHPDAVRVRAVRCGVAVNCAAFFKSLPMDKLGVRYKVSWDADNERLELAYRDDGKKGAM